jgi:hypothetical protein
MTKQEFELFLQEAAKVLTMDSSHSAVRDKLQSALTAAHRANSGDSYDYSSGPYVRDVFGDADSGNVVHSTGGKHTMSEYKSNGSGGYDLKNHKPVRQAYVTDTKVKGESWKPVVLDGTFPVLLEAVLAANEFTEVIELTEAKGSAAKVTLISAGKGSSGYYTEQALKTAAKDGIFAAGTHMMLNHQTKEERLARPEGDITKLAGKLTSKAEYVEGTGGKPGKLVASAHIYPEFAPFIAARKDDIGVSVRVGAEPSGKLQEGLPLVEKMVYALSTDFVTRAGRGGEITEMFESFRQQQAEHKEQDMTDEEKALMKTLQESNAKYALRLDRLEEDNTNLRVSKLVAESLSDSGLTPRAQKRITTAVMGNVPMKDGKLDEVKLQESIKAAVTDEVAYLQEAGVHVGPKLVRFAGGHDTPVQKDKDGKEIVPPDVLAEADTRMNAGIDSIMGRKPVAKEAGKTA